MAAFNYFDLAQLKRVFHMLESLGFARIEGNHTTLADYVESSLEGMRGVIHALSNESFISAPLSGQDRTP